MRFCRYQLNNVAATVLSSRGWPGTHRAGNRKASGEPADFDNGEAVELPSIRFACSLR